MNTANHNSVIKIGIIGTGRIANRFIDEAATVTSVDICSVYNPNLLSAEKFASTHNINFSNNLTDLYNNVDAVYIASPHNTHYNYIKCALVNKKHVLCEKPMVLKKEQAIELFALAKQKQCVLLEAIKTAYSPGFIEVIKAAKSGKIGEIKDVEASFTKLIDNTLRELNDDKIGGSFTELASYTLLGIIKTLGTKYQDLRFESFNASNGVDIYTKAYLRYANSFATSKTGLGVKSEGQLLISGTNGYIRVDAPWWKTKSFEICYENFNKNENYTFEFEGDGLRYELSEFVFAINSVDKTSTRLTNDEIIFISEIIEKFLDKR